MNFLAHIFLSCENDDLLLGNFMADFIKNSEVKEYSIAIQRGIKLHRKIDSFTDHHEMVRQGSRRLMDVHGKYSPVVIDILYDNILTKNWSKYHSDTLLNFSNNVYDLLLNRKEELPLKLQKRVPRMVEDNFLLKYGTTEGLRFALKSMDKRTKFPSNFPLAIQQLEDEWELFNNEFNVFFPEVIKMSKDFCDC